MPAEPTILCPNCQAEIKLTESLAAPLIAATKREFDTRLAQQNAEVAKRESAMKQQEEAVARQKESVEATVSERISTEREKLAAEAAKREAILKQAQAALANDKEQAEAKLAARLQEERGKIAADEAKKAKLAIGNDLEQKAKELAEISEILKARDAKLAEAQKAQADILRKERELADARREMELTIQKGIDEQISKVRETAKRDAEESLTLKLIEKDTMIGGLKRTIDDLQKKAEQGSQQLQGEALELQLETLLGVKFAYDSIEPVGKGERGADILHRVNNPNGGACGTILWETKRTKNWMPAWLPKLRDDQRNAKAEVAVIVSGVLPDGVENFAQIDNVWVVHPRCILPLAITLRHMLVEIATVRQAGEGRQSKMEMIYAYLTGPRFRQRVETMNEVFKTMGNELQKEKKAMQAQWAKREIQINRLVEATTGMWGEMQGIAGQSLQEIEGFELDGDADATPLLGSSANV